MVYLRQAVRVVPASYFELFPEQVRRSQAEHADMLEAFDGGDSAAARTLTELHVLEAGAALGDWLRETRTRVGIGKRVAEVRRRDNSAALGGDGANGPTAKSLELLVRRPDPGAARHRRHVVPGRLCPQRSHRRLSPGDVGEGIE